MKQITPYEDIIDSRDVMERIEELSDTPENELDLEERKELANLKSLSKEASDYAEDWQYGEVLIRDSYFKEYAEELAYEIGALNKDYNWPHNCIDWERAARELQMDYTCVEFDGIDYWIR